MERAASTRACSVCRRRPAVYYRRLSGDLLCSRCLERQLLRSVKRVLSRSKTLRPKQRVLLWISPVDLWGSAALASILPVIERSQASETVLAYPDIIDYNVDKDQDGIVDVVRVDGSFYKHRDDLNSCIRIDRALSRIIAEKQGLNVIILPYTRDTLTLASLDAVMRGPWAVSETIEKLEAGDIVYVAGMASIEAEAAAAYSFLNSLKINTRVKCRSQAKRIMTAVAPGRPELVYSSSKTSQLFADAASKLLGAKLWMCKVCGGYTPSRDEICDVCKGLGLEEASRKG